MSYIKHLMEQKVEAEIEAEVNSGMFSEGITKGDTVKILPPTGKEFDNDRFGVVTNVDGAYILVKRSISGVEVELYPNELEVISKAESADADEAAERGYN
jgi:hypothetical protein